MKQIDFDRAFAQTPDEIHERICTAFEKGEKHMKFRHKMLSTLSVAAVLVVVFAVIGFAGRQMSAPKPDTLAAPITQSGRTPELTEEPNEIEEIQENQAAELTPTPMPTESPNENSSYAVSPWDEDWEAENSSCESNAEPDNTPVPLSQEVMAEIYYGVYCTEDGAYYHKDAACSGMHNALLCSVKAAAEDGKLPCPICCDFEIYVYATQEGSYYHALATCSGMQGATEHKISDGIMTEKQPCPNCIPETVYATLFGDCYHSEKECSGMLNAMETYGYVAVQAGKLPCPNCIGETELMLGGGYLQE